MNKIKAVNELADEVKDTGTNKATGYTLQSLLWEGAFEERIYLDDKRVFSRLITDDGVSLTDFAEVKEVK